MIHTESPIRLLFFTDKAKTSLLLLHLIVLRSVNTKSVLKVLIAGSFLVFRLVVFVVSLVTLLTPALLPTFTFRVFIELIQFLIYFTNTTSL